jgi:hypothetical protein
MQDEDGLDSRAFRQRRRVGSWPPSPLMQDEDKEVAGIREEPTDAAASPSERERIRLQ